MSDTIDMLEAIGRDASLRHASAAALARLLEQVRASDGLRSAVASGDCSPLKAEFGYRTMQVPQSTQHPGYEEEVTEPPPVPDPARKKDPLHAPAPSPAPSRDEPPARS